MLANFRPPFRYITLFSVHCVLTILRRYVRGCHKRCVSTFPLGGRPPRNSNCKLCEDSHKEERFWVPCLRVRGVVRDSAAGFLSQ